MPQTHIFDDLELKKQLFYGKICTLLFVTLSHMIGLSSIVCKRREIDSLYWISTFSCTTTSVLWICVKTCYFHCTRRSKNWEFQILQIIDFLKTTKMISECQSLLRLLVCASSSCIGVSWTCRGIAITTFWIYIPPLNPPPPPLSFPPTLKKRWVIENMLKISFFKVDCLVDFERWLSCQWH